MMMVCSIAKNAWSIGRINLIISVIDKTISKWLKTQLKPITICCH